jgi:beta-N-acetylhexosaminidase
MEGAATVGDFPERARLAQHAGCDMILVCNNPAAAEQVLEALPISPNPLREQRLQTMRGKPQLNREQLSASEKWRHVAALINTFTDTYAERN